MENKIFCIRRSINNDLVIVSLLATFERRQNMAFESVFCSTPLKTIKAVMEFIVPC